MTQFYLFEIKQFINGEREHTVHWAFDEDATKARLKAESKYHELLAAAAISETLEHAVTLLASDGRAVMNQCYRHAVETEPVEETTVEEETPVEEEEHLGI